MILYIYLFPIFFLRKLLPLFESKILHGTMTPDLDQGRCHEDHESIRPPIAGLIKYGLQ